MKTLETDFERNGFKFRQIQREGSIAIYERRHETTPREHFEVIKIRVRPAREVFGKQFPESEYYPSSEEWGQFAWTCGDLAGAKGLAATLTGGKQSKSLLAQTV